MDENQTNLEVQSSDLIEPTVVENSNNDEFEVSKNNDSTIEIVQEEGESTEPQIEILDPSNELILGKFKTVEDLTKAYEELQKKQGKSSEELGNLRKEIAGANELKEKWAFFNSKKDEFLETINRDKQKYSSPEYFGDPTFKEIYKEALLVYGADLDTDRMINLLENYVSTRIQSSEKKKFAQIENEIALDSMEYSSSQNSKFIPPKKTFDEMTSNEVDELLDRLI